MPSGGLRGWQLQAAGSSAASCGVSGVKVTSRLQRKVESSVARSATDDGSVVLASVTSLAPDGHHLLDPVTPFEAAVNCPSVPGSPKCPRLSATLQVGGPGGVAGKKLLLR